MCGTLLIKVFKISSYRYRRFSPTVSVGILVLMTMICSGSGCTKNLDICPSVVGVTDVGPVGRDIVHPIQEVGTRAHASWSEIGYSGPFLIVRIATEEDLQLLADQRRVYHVGYRVYACSEKPNWSAEIANGPLFPVEEPKEDTVPQGMTHGDAHRYEIYVPLDLSDAISGRIDNRVGVDLVNELQRAEENGLCVFLIGGKAYGGGFSSDLVRLPVSVIDGRIEAAGTTTSPKEAMIDLLQSNGHTD